MHDGVAWRVPVRAGHNGRLTVPPEARPMLLAEVTTDWWRDAGAVVAVLTAVALVVDKVVAARRERREDDRSADEQAHRMTAEERDATIKSMQKHQQDRERIHNADMAERDRRIGELYRHGEECEKAHRRCEVANARLIERLKAKDLLTETDEQEILREDDE